MARFSKYVGIDYSGANAPEASLAGLQGYCATPESDPIRQAPVPERCPRLHWCRSDLADWLIAELAAGSPIIVGIDHSFSFPDEYFDRRQICKDWDAFLADFAGHWPTDQRDTWVRDVRNGHVGLGSERRGEANWFRLTEQLSGSAKSVFQFGVNGEVASSTHAGLPWLRTIRAATRGRVHFWPFDGWDIPAGQSAVVEVSPSLWKSLFPPHGRNEHEHDAYSVARWMREADAACSLETAFAPELSEAAKATGRFEGWILGVGVKPSWLRHH